MKVSRLLSSGILFLAAMALLSCVRQTPVDRYTEIMGKLTEEIEKCQDISDITRISNSRLGEESTAIIQENADYELTDSDKEKIKEANDRMMQAIFNKTVELSGIPTEMHSRVQAQMNTTIEMFNAEIDNSKTLGDLSFATH